MLLVDWPCAMGVGTAFPILRDEGAEGGRYPQRVERGLDQDASGWPLASQLGAHEAAEAYLSIRHDPRIPRVGVRVGPLRAALAVQGYLAHKKQTPARTAQ